MRISFQHTLKAFCSIAFLVLSGPILQAQSVCDTLFVPRGNMFPPERRELCQSDTIILQGMRPGNGFEMRWFRNGAELAGETQEVLKATQAGTYSLRLLRDGCLSTVFDTVRISFRNQMRPKVRQLNLQQSPALPGSQFTLQLQSIGNTATVSRSWYRNGILEKNSGLSFTSRNTGRYRVRTDSLGCSSFSNEVLVRPAGSFVPQICLSEPVEPNGLRVEWIPLSDTAVKQFKVYRKKYFESVFSFVDSLSPAAGAWINDTLLYRTAYDVMITARVSGGGGDYESEPSLVNKTIYLSVQPAPGGTSGGNLLNWNSYEGFPVSSYYIFRNEQVADSVAGTQNTWQDLNPPVNPKYRIEALANENCTSTLTDIDGNVYQTVQIGNQIWMKENLKTTRYRNGGQLLANPLDWQNTLVGAYTNYSDFAAYNETYGKLYNWYAVAGGLCPDGWHVPTDHDWNMLTIFLDPSADTSCLGCINSAGSKMKSTGTLLAGTGLWVDENTDATNSSGFKGLPGGGCDSFPIYFGIENLGRWWSSTEINSGYARYLELVYNYSGAFRFNDVKAAGYSVRCLKN